MKTELLPTIVGALLAIGVLALAAFVVWLLSAIEPWVIVGVLTSLAAVLGAIPPIITAVRGGRAR